MKILLAVDGSKPSLDDDDCLIDHADRMSAIGKAIAGYPPAKSRRSPMSRCCS